MSSDAEALRLLSDEELEQLVIELKALRSDNEIMKRLLSTLEMINHLLSNRLKKCETNETIDQKVMTKINVLNHKYNDLKSALDFGSNDNDFNSDMIVITTDGHKQTIECSSSDQQMDPLSDCEDNDSNEVINQQMIRSNKKSNIVFINFGSINKSSVECNASDVEEEEEEETEDNDHKIVHKCKYSDSKTNIQCLKEFESIEILADHMSGHTGERPWFCDYPNCHYRATHRSHLIGHRRKSHTGRFQFKCDWPGCDFRGPSRYNVKRHKRIHTGEKPYKCDWPGCEFQSPNNKMADHKRIHTGEKPFVCSWVGCDSRFSRSFTLRNHERTHTGEKPFACDYPNCDYRSSQQTPLSTHKRKHHNFTHVLSEEVIIAENVIISDE